jgi:hypothetical protein
MARYQDVCVDAGDAGQKWIFIPMCRYDSKWV